MAVGDRRSFGSGRSGLKLLRLAAKFYYGSVNKSKNESKPCSPKTNSVGYTTKDYCSYPDYPDDKFPTMFL